MKTYCPVRPANRAVSGDLLGSEGDEAGDDVKTPVDEGGPYRGGVPHVGRQQLNALRNSAENGVARLSTVNW